MYNLFASFIFCYFCKKYLKRGEELVIFAENSFEKI